MVRVSLFFAIFLSVVVVTWIAMSDLGGYTSRNAMIIARSTPIVSTMDGEVTFVAPAVGSKVVAGSLVATIQNNRIDRSRIMELLGQQALLEWEVDGAEALSKELDSMKSRFAQRADAYWNWTQKDLEILRRQTGNRCQRDGVSCFGGDHEIWQRRDSGSVLDVEPMSEIVEE